MGWKWTEEQLAAYMETINGKKAHLIVVPKMTEKQFQEQVRKAAIMNGWRFHHAWTSIHSSAGFPDCIMVKGHRLIFAELKTETGKVTEGQVEWLADIGNTGAEAYLWRPSDMDAIWEILKA